MFKHFMQTNINKTQRGFVPERQLVHNVIDLDSAGRILALRAMQHNASEAKKAIACLAFFDFAAAFPSIIHAWIFAVLVHQGFPIGFINLIKTLYTMAGAFSNASGQLCLLFWYLSGVIQGCPASAFLFDICLDPFLAAFDKVLVAAGRGILRACADDIGIALKSLATFKYLFPIFDSAQMIAGLTLKPSKCNVIPTSEQFSEELVARIKAWLNANVPGWANFSIKSSAKYLGFYLGPSANELQWKEPIAKFTSRALALNRTSNPVSINSYLYNCCCSSVVQYKAQLLFLPPNFSQTERTAMQAVFHLATNSLDHASFFYLFIAGGPKIQSASVAAKAAIFRTACNSYNIWSEWKRQLDSISLDVLSLQEHGAGLRSPAWWDTAPIALNLAQAWFSFPGDTRWHAGAAAAHNEISSAILKRRDGPNHTQDIKKLKTQAIAYKHLLAHRFPNKFEVFFIDFMSNVIDFVSNCIHFN